jgi:hypothetical protein
LKSRQAKASGFEAKFNPFAGPQLLDHHPFLPHLCGAIMGFSVLSLLGVLFLCALAVTTIGVVQAAEKNVYVDSTATAGGTGTEANPCNTLSCGLSVSASFNGMVIVNIAAGTYVGLENADLCATASACPANFTLLGPTVDDETPLVTIEAYEIDFRALVLEKNQTVMLKYLTFQGYHQTNDIAYVEEFGPTKSFTNGGAAIMATSGSITIYMCQFFNNSAVAGGAIAAVNTALYIAESKFIQNKVGLFGGAILSYQAPLQVDHCHFELNMAADYFKEGIDGKTLDGSGGAIYANILSETAVIIANSNFYNNSAGGSGGAVFISAASETHTTINITVCKFFYNSVAGSGICLTSSTCDSSGGALFISAYSFGIADSNFTSNTVTSSAANVVSICSCCYQVVLSLQIMAACLCAVFSRRCHIFHIPILARSSEWKD